MPPQVAFEYQIQASLESEAILLEAAYRDRTTFEPLSAPIYTEFSKTGSLSEEQKKFLNERHQMRTSFMEKAELVVGDPSKPLRISQSVPPKGVDSFRIKFNVEGLGRHGYYYFPATAVIHYDDGEAIVTPPFEIYLRQCMPNDLFRPTRCPRD